MISNGKRIEWIDIVRFIGISWIVIYHIGLFPKTFSTYASTFQLPLFWFLSGYCISQKKSLKHIVKNNLNRLIIPYFFLGFVILFYKIVTFPAVSYNISFFRFIRNYVFFLAIMKPGYGINPMWFLPSLFAVSTLFQISLLSDKHKVSLIFILVTIFFTVEPSQIKYLLESFEGNPVIEYIIEIIVFYYHCIREGFIFFTIGNILKRNKFFKNKITIQSTIKFQLLKIALFLVINYILIYYWNNIFKLTFLLHFRRYIVGLSGIMLWISIAKLVPAGNIFLFFGRNTLIILCFHSPVIEFLRIVNVFLINHINFINLFVLKKTTFISQVQSGLLMLILTMLIMIPLIRYICKYFPCFIGHKSLLSVSRNVLL
ncbi:MAG: acyltransferase family protein [Candidatus Latescibacteria bacterium]|nr:acyltransferase family protein [Candidatus Latescibacterota bacterium]